MITIPNDTYKVRQINADSPVMMILCNRLLPDALFHIFTCKFQSMRNGSLILMLWEMHKYLNTNIVYLCDKDYYHSLYQVIKFCLLSY